ncbi:MAG: hypothetical protein HT580_11665 [Dechloromonas sp.]|nr:MAG: hypothetical protein HT580_11665 [Dechloromonas sp.]
MKTGAAESPESRAMSVIGTAKTDVAPQHELQSIDYIDLSQQDRIPTVAKVLQYSN